MFKFTTLFLLTVLVASTSIAQKKDVVKEKFLGELVLETDSQAQTLKGDLINITKGSYQVSIHKGGGGPDGMIIDSNPNAFIHLGNGCCAVLTAYVNSEKLMSRSLIGSTVQKTQTECLLKSADYKHPTCRTISFDFGDRCAPDEKQGEPYVSYDPPHPGFESLESRRRVNAECCKGKGYEIPAVYGVLTLTTERYSEVYLQERVVNSKDHQQVGTLKGLNTETVDYTKSHCSK